MERKRRPNNPEYTVPQPMPQQYAQPMRPQQPCYPQPQPPMEPQKKKKRRFHFGFGSIFRTFLMLSGAAAWIFLILKYVIVPLLSMISGNG